MIITFDLKAVKQTLTYIEQNHQNALQQTLQKAGDNLRKKMIAVAYPSVVKM